MDKKSFPKFIRFEGCNYCKHQIAPLRMCKWAENGGDGQVHIICPYWCKKSGGLNDKV